MDKEKYGLFIFRRDLRLTDNNALNELSKHVKYIIPIFIFDTAQIEKNNHNKYYYSNNAVQFICESVELLRSKIPLSIFKTDNINTLLLRICKKIDISYIAFNLEIANERDEIVTFFCKKYNINLITSYDITFFDLDKYKYSKVFSVFYKHARKIQIPKPKTRSMQFKRVNFGFEFNNLRLLYVCNELLSQHPTAKIQPKLSASLNMGIMSIRECYYKIKKSKSRDKKRLLRSLYWRDFYVVFFYNLLLLGELTPKTLYSKFINSRFEKIHWKMKKSEFKALYECKTGFLNVDASMKELVTTGFTNNRNRMILAIFWNKYLQINPFDLKYGAQTHFSKHLVDAIGFTQNLGNQHFMIDTDYGGYRFGRGISGRPFNIEKIEDIEHIKYWIPELKNADIKHWNRQQAIDYNYPLPIFNAKKRYKLWINMTKKL